MPLAEGQFDLLLSLYARVAALDSEFQKMLIASLIRKMTCAYLYNILIQG
jgi:hypothetical protein